MRLDGFGAAFARQALAPGYNVVATTPREDKLKVIEAIDPARVLVHRMDVMNATEIDHAVLAAQVRFGGTDVLINNAGYGIVGAVEETPQDRSKIE